MANGFFTNTDPLDLIMKQGSPSIKAKVEALRDAIQNQQAGNIVTPFQGPALTGVQVQQNRNLSSTYTYAGSPILYPTFADGGTGAMVETKRRITADELYDRVSGLLHLLRSGA